MHSFLTRPFKQLKMRHIPRHMMEPHAGEMIDLLACSADPYSGMLYEIEIDTIRQLVKELGAALGKHITLTPVIIKLIAHAIAENPVFNRLLLGGKLYEFEEIHIANLVIVPGSGAITYVVLENPHLKSLADIQQELFAGLARAKERFALPHGRLEALITHLIYRYGLYRLIGQKRTFSTGYQRGMVSNISVSVHTYATPSNFIMVKDVISPLPFYPKIHVCGPVKKPVLDDGMLVCKELLHIHVTSDHRIVNGVHAHEFGRSMARIAENPEQYLQ
jgi:pyruvate/2-oxoglutarate dehydrogenase complex dihydrolipoamide acyltransferase (E2) component